MRFDKKLAKNFLLDISFLIIEIFFISVLYKDNLLLTTIVLILSFSGIYFWHKKRYIILFLSGALLGPLAEIIAIHFGVWNYTNPTITGIPMWLPPAWGMATVIINRFAEFMLLIHEKKANYTIRLSR